MPDTLPNIQVNTNLFIDNKFVPAASGKTFDVLNPHDESLLAKVAEGDRADVDRAVSAAQKAFPVWSNMAASARGALIYKLAQAIEEDGENLALIETLDTGHPIRDTRNLDVFRTAAVFRYFGAHPHYARAIMAGSTFFRPRARPRSAPPRAQHHSARFAPGHAARK